MKTESWRDDYELDGVHPTIANAIHEMHTWHAADAANRRAGMATSQTFWPFPAKPIPIDNKPAPRGPDAEDAPW